MPGLLGLSEPDDDDEVLSLAVQQAQMAAQQQALGLPPPGAEPGGPEAGGEEGGAPGGGGRPGQGPSAEQMAGLLGEMEPGSAGGDHPRPTLARRSGGSVRYDAGRWVTIGARSGEEGGKKTGGSPVFIKDGKIVKGHPSLAGRSLETGPEGKGGLSKERTYGTPRQQGPRGEGPRHGFLGQEGS